MKSLNGFAASLVVILAACEERSTELQDSAASSKQLQPNQPVQGASADLPGPEVRLKTVFEPGKRYIIKQVQKEAMIRSASFGNEKDISESSQRYEMLLSLDFTEGGGSGKKAIASYDHIAGSMQFPSDDAGTQKTIDFVSEEGERFGLKSQVDAHLELELELAFDQNGKLVRRNGPASDEPGVPFGNGINTGPGSDMIEQLFRSFTEGFPEEPIEPGHRWEHAQKLPTLPYGEIELLCDYSYDGMELPPNGTTKLAKVGFKAKLGEAGNAGRGLAANVTSKLDAFDCNGAIYFDVEKKSIVYTATDVKIRTVNYLGEDEIGSVTSEIVLVNELDSVVVERATPEE